MLENETENPFSRAAIEKSQILARLNYTKIEARQVSERADIAERFSFNRGQLTLFELAMAKYLIRKSGGEAAALLRDPVSQMMARIPIIKILPSILEYSQREDEKVVKMLSDEMEPMLETEVKAGEYLPRSILGAANIVSSSWIVFREGGEDFLTAVEKRTDYLKNIVLRKKSP